jgi:two-component system sensor histidine kinase ChvG
MDPQLAGDILQLLSNPRSQRARLYDAQGHLLVDSYWGVDRVERKLLPPAKPRAGQDNFLIDFDAARGKPKTPVAVEAERALDAEVKLALRGDHPTGIRIREDGGRVVSVSIPLQRVQAVLGVLTLEASGVDEIIRKEREDLIPFILTAIAATLISSILLSQLIARPVRRLARAADSVRLSRARAISLPELAGRNDELGDLTRSLEDMTHALSERMDAIESFAADVAHEIRNPLTSMRSAVETLDLISDPAARDRLLKILKNDIQRLDRLVTDISNASRLDAELSRETPKSLDLERMIGDSIALYQATAKEGDVRVRFIPPDMGETIMVPGREVPLGQVIRNLIDNARSFSPPGGEVRVILARDRGQATVMVEDDGPGIPPENLETVFQRFYTSRPKGAAFGGNSGLGLSIARQIVEAQGGRIYAENREAPDGQISGARFIVRLPQAAP